MNRYATLHTNKTHDNVIIGQIALPVILKSDSGTGVLSSQIWSSQDEHSEETSDTKRLLSLQRWFICQCFRSRWKQKTKSLLNAPCFNRMEPPPENLTEPQMIRTLLWGSVRCVVKERPKTHSSDTNYKKGLLMMSMNESVIIIIRKKKKKKKKNITKCNL